MHLRHKLRLTQAELAERLGVSRNYVSMMEGGRPPSRSLVLLIEDLEEQAKDGRKSTGDARATMRKAREAKGWSIKDLAKATGYSIGVLQALEEGNGRGSERQIKKVATALDVPFEDLMQGVEPGFIDESGLTGTLGASPNVELGPGIKTARYVPLISFAQAGKMGSWEDAAYEYTGHIAFDMTDPKAFGVTIRGDSMVPVINDGDVAILVPSSAPRGGEVVVARLSEEAGGGVMCKVYTPKDAGAKVVLTSYNSAVHPPLEFRREDFVWLYPVDSVTKKFRRP